MLWETVTLQCSSFHPTCRQLGEVEEERVPLAGQDALAVYRQHMWVLVLLYLNCYCWQEQS
jgi:hypothetical protein